MKKQTYIVTGLVVLAIAGGLLAHWYNTPTQRLKRLEKQYGSQPIYKSIQTSLTKNINNVYKNPEDTASVLGLGTNFYILGDYSTALSYYKKAEKLDPNNFLPHYNAGQAYNALKQYDEAKSEFLTSNRLNPDHYGTYFELENLYVIHYKDQLGDMEALYKKAIELYPTDENFKAALNQFYDRTGQQEKMTK